MRRWIVVLATVFFVFSLSVSVGLAEVDYCEGNFDYDENVDGSDVVIFANHFGRNQYNNPCPPDGPAPVPKTGQTTCYDESGTEIDCTGTGQDGEYQSGVPWPNPRFTDNGDGTVTDLLTGLIWLKDANCYYASAWTWIEAHNLANNLSSGDCNLTDGSIAGDWRVPSRNELESLLDISNHAPSLPNNHPFERVQANGVYWTSNTVIGHIDSAWLVFLSNGIVHYSVKTAKSYGFWPVRGGH